MLDIKYAILSSATKYIVDGFETKSQTGGVVNVYNAVKDCQKRENSLKTGKY
jgi:hypothetical protein